jgi:hypothetical protein
MKTLAACLLLLACAALAQTDTQKSFDELKSLTGSWEGKNSMGEPVQVLYRMTGEGSALMSEINGHGHDMISMFTLDGANRLILTHIVGWQPAAMLPARRPTARPSPSTFSTRPTSTARNPATWITW